MSSFIETTEQIKSRPIINNALRKIVFHHQSIRSSINTVSLAQQSRQRSFLKEICHRIKIEERQKIRNQAHQQAKEQLSSLKYKLRRNITKENIQYMMGEKKCDNQDILSKVMRIPIQTISIDRAHRRKINLKLSLMEEAQRIINDKEEYQRWYNLNKNSTTSSPIFRKMNFLLQRLSKKQDSVISNYLNHRKSLDTEPFQQKNPASYHKINRKKTEENDIARW